MRLIRVCLCVYAQYLDWSVLIKAWLKCIYCIMYYNFYWLYLAVKKKTCVMFQNPSQEVVCANQEPLLCLVTWCAAGCSTSTSGTLGFPSSPDWSVPDLVVVVFLPRNCILTCWFYITAFCLTQSIWTSSLSIRIIIKGTQADVRAVCINVRFSAVILDFRFNFNFWLKFFCCHWI